MEIKISSKKRLLVVGGTGFIGKHIVKESLKQGYITSVISKNKKKSRQHFKSVSYINVDISDKLRLTEHLQKKEYEYVINLGGYVDHSDYSKGGIDIFKVHFNGVINLISSLDKKKIKGFVQIGSSDEYGNNPAPQHEDQREQPISPYSCAKVLSTHYLQFLYKTEKFPAVILRPFLVYGPGQGNERFIPQIIKGCKFNEKFSVSSGTQKRDFCYIDDFVNAVFLSLVNNEAHGEVINIASGAPVKIKNLVNKIVGIHGAGNPKFGQVPLRPSTNMDLYADISKAQRILKWSPHIDLENGLSKTIFEFDDHS